MEKVKRPTINSSGTSEEWAYFNTRWKEYVEATGVTGKTRVIQLLECCDDELRRDLTRLAGGSVANKEGDTVLAMIQKLAMRIENGMVAGVNLQNMQQDRDEPVRSFCARLRGQANVCKYTVTCLDCNKNINYTN